MRNRSLRAAAAAFALCTLGVSTTAQADHDSFIKVDRFEGHIVFCAPQDPPLNVEILPDGVEIVTFLNIGNIWVTGNPLVDGVEKNISVITFDPASEDVVIKQRGKVEVAAVDGKWKFRQFITISPTGAIGKGIGIGKGDLRGKLMLFETGTAEFIENSPCEVPFGVPLRGKIIGFGWVG